MLPSHVDASTKHDWMLRLPSMQCVPFCPLELAHPDGVPGSTILTALFALPETTKCSTATQLPFVATPSEDMVRTSLSLRATLTGSRRRDPHQGRPSRRILQLTRANNPRRDPGCCRPKPLDNSDPRAPPSTFAADIDGQELVLDPLDRLNSSSFTRAATWDELDRSRRSLRCVLRACEGRELIWTQRMRRGMFSPEARSGTFVGWESRVGVWLGSRYILDLGVF